MSGIWVKSIRIDGKDIGHFKLYSEWIPMTEGRALVRFVTLQEPFANLEWEGFGAWDGSTGEVWMNSADVVSLHTRVPMNLPLEGSDPRRRIRSPKG